MSLVPTEEWRPVVGYESLYLVSDRGRIWSVVAGRLKIAAPNVRSGYYQIRLHKNSQGKNYRVHRLVAEAFCPRAEGQDIVRHLDGDRSNNYFKNLAWGTGSDNNYDTVAHGRHVLGNRTACAKGHPFTPENTKIRSKGNGRQCRTCHREVALRGYYKRKAAS